MTRGYERLIVGGRVLTQPPHSLSPTGCQNPARFHRASGTPGSVPSQYPILNGSKRHRRRRGVPTGMEPARNAWYIVPMSYDMHFAKVPAGVPFDEYIEQLTIAEESAPLDPAVEAQKLEIAAALRAVLPELEPFKKDFAEIARLEGTSVADARRSHRAIELNQEPGPGDGLQILISDAQVSISVPYWHTGSAAEAVFEKIARCVGVLTARGFTCHDPQLGRDVNIASDRPEMIAHYLSISTRLDEITGVTRTKPWWKFWS